MGKVVLARKCAFGDRLRSYKIFLDGLEVGKIRNGQTWRADCVDGQHTLQLKIDWCSSPELSFETNGDFECQSSIVTLKDAFNILILFAGEQYIQLNHRAMEEQNASLKAISTEQ
ncbi:MAG: hypothetical protein AB7O96_10490 [Pseudobdellovibrionaceae bacterium]